MTKNPKKMSRMTEPETQVTFSPLVAEILSAQVAHTAAINDRVIESLQAQLKYLEAWRSIVESRIYRLCSQSWTPSPQSIKSALIVSQEEIDDWIAEGEGNAHG